VGLNFNFGGLSPPSPHLSTPLTVNLNKLSRKNSFTKRRRYSKLLHNRGCWSSAIGGQRTGKLIMKHPSWLPVNACLRGPNAYAGRIGSHAVIHIFFFFRSVVTAVYILDSWCTVYVYTLDRLVMSRSILIEEYLHIIISP
jgi:hypothetical protein